MSWPTDDRAAFEENQTRERLVHVTLDLKMWSKMLYEVTKVKQHKGEPKRRWFIDEYFDLVLWQNETNGIAGFQLCYDKTKDMHALTWYEETGFMHNRVDDGENKPGKYKSIPVLLPNGLFPSQTVAEKFKEESSDIDPELAEFIYRKILEI